MSTLCTYPMFDASRGELPCSLPELTPGSGRCWRHHPSTAALRSRIARTAAVTRRRRRSFWGRVRAAIGFPVRGAVVGAELTPTPTPETP